MVVSFVVRRRRGDRKSNRTDFVVVVVLDDDGEEEDEEEEEALQNEPPAREKATFEENKREDMMLKAQLVMMCRCVLNSRLQMGKSSKTHLLTKLLPLSRARNTQSAEIIRNHQKSVKECRRK